jgi:hypothetical protein
MAATKAMPAVPSVAAGNVIRVALWIGWPLPSEYGSLSHGVLPLLRNTTRRTGLVFPTLRRVVRRTPEGPLLSGRTSFILDYTNLVVPK